jgi:hypothetical protein
MTLRRASRAIALTTALAAGLTLGLAEHAAAFCGFYVTGADTSLYANATMVVLMRDGTRTVLSMQNNYEGPPNAFALVIPVPMVLQKENVKVLPRDVFTRVDSLGAPRLVEYWEMDPCLPAARGIPGGVATAAQPSMAPSAGSSADSVKIEAQFAVGEYDVVVLSADDSSALDTWLRDNQYNIPDGAAPVLAPYVAAGMKFFVAKVDVSRVTFNGDQAVLSPLRFYYDTPEFSLPVRLGLLNSQGSQDLIVNILAAQRYEVANYPNVTVPTNIRVQNDVRNGFGSFYEALFAKTLEKNPKAVVTEYSWASSSCDPCPTPPLTPQDIATLGGDVLQSASSTQPPAGGSAPIIAPPGPGGFNAYGFTLTRLHARYSKDMLGEDLVFQQASGIVGGRGIPDTKGNLDQTVMMTTYNNFQGRYVILHPWEKAISCAMPQRGQWGGPGGTFGSPPMTQATPNTALVGMTPKAGDLPSLLAESIPQLSVNAKNPLDPLKPAPAANGAAGTSAAGAGANQGQAGATKGPSQQTSAGSGVNPQQPSGPNTLPSGPEGTPPAAKKDRGCAVTNGEPGSSFGLFAAVAGLALFVRRSARRASQARS